MSDKKGNRDWVAIAAVVLPIVGTIFWSWTNLNTRMAVVEIEVKYIQAEIESIKLALPSH